MPGRAITISRYDMFTSCITEEIRGTFVGVLTEAGIEVAPGPEPTPDQETRALGKYAKRMSLTHRYGPKRRGAGRASLTVPSS